MSRSMRLECAQLARKHKAAFAVIYIPCPLACSLFHAALPSSYFYHTHKQHSSHFFLGHRAWPLQGTRSAMQQSGCLWRF